ncbi:MAG: hypothetical protein J0H38_08670 [Rhizobiales bacterium]|nr:hypothetical protein [Hyphomicrobiales bacterium]
MFILLTGDSVPIKNVVIPIETEYLEEAARVRRISRTRLVQIVMEKIVTDQLVTSVLNDDDREHTIESKPRYRRFQPRG